jgi:hypothetical protein
MGNPIVVIILIIWKNPIISLRIWKNPIIIIFINMEKPNNYIYTLLKTKLKTILF